MLEIPDEAEPKHINFSDLYLLIIVLNKNVFPVPPGASIKHIFCSSLNSNK